MKSNDKNTFAAARTPFMWQNKNAFYTSFPCDVIRPGEVEIEGSKYRRQRYNCCIKLKLRYLNWLESLCQNAQALFILFIELFISVLYAISLYNFLFPKTFFSFPPLNFRENKVLISFFPLDVWLQTVLFFHFPSNIYLIKTFIFSSLNGKSKNQPVFFHFLWRNV